MAMIQLWTIFKIIGITILPVINGRVRDLVIESTRRGATSPAQNKAACPVNSARIRETCYWLTKQRDTYKGADNECIQHGGRLAILKTQKLVDFVMKLNENPFNEQGFWVGMHDLVRKGDWRYVDGTKVIEKDMWAQGEPNGGGPTCGGIQTVESDALLYDDDCNHTLRGVCELGGYSNLESICPTHSIFSEDRQSCYWATNAMTFQEANDECKKYGGGLAIVKDKSKAKTIIALARPKTPSEGLWVGMNDLHQKGEWSYLDGTPVTQQHIQKLWIEGEPNGGGSTCGGVLYDKQQYKFYDNACRNLLPAVCELTNRPKQ